MAFGPILRGDVGREWPDVPGAEIEDVSHATELSPNRGRSGRSRYRISNGGKLMRAFLVDIAAKVIIRSNTDPNELPADIYAQIAEYIHSDDDILDLSIEAMPLPHDLSGQASDR